MKIYELITELAKLPAGAKVFVPEKGDDGLVEVGSVSIDDEGDVSIFGEPKPEDDE